MGKVMNQVNQWKRLNELLREYYVNVGREYPCASFLSPDYLRVTGHAFLFHSRCITR